MHHSFRDHYLSIANGAGEPDCQDGWPGAGWSQDFPLDLPDDHGAWDWPDAPHPVAPAPDVNDRNFAWGWLAASTLISIGLLIYLALQVA